MTHCTNRILIVEDNKLDMRLLKDILEGSGTLSAISTLWAAPHRATKALAIVASWKNRPAHHAAIGIEMTERRGFDWVAACRTHRFPAL
jgi:CheY-like chemotaxis protein